MRSLLTCINLVLYVLVTCQVLDFATVQLSSKVSGMEDSLLLRYSVKDVHTGELEHVIQLSNNSTTPIKGDLIVPLVGNRTARHYAILRNVSVQTVQDNSGNIYFRQNDLAIGGGETFRLQLDYHVLSFNIQYQVDPTTVEDYSKQSEIYKKNTQSEELIESNNSAIMSLARNLTNDIDCWHRRAQRIYDFVDRHMHYEAQDYENGALWALKNGVGDCSEYSYLYVALCRAAGIPSRIQAGFAFHQASNNVEDGHMWAEYYIDNYGWIPVDVTWHLFAEMDERHFSSIQSIPDVIHYANYVYDCESKDSTIQEEQIVSWTLCESNAFGDSFSDEILDTVLKIRQAHLALFLGKIFGASVAFASETERIERTLLQAEIQVQEAIEFWSQDIQKAESKIANALEIIDELSQDAWTLVAVMFLILVSIMAVIMLTAFYFLRPDSRAGKGFDRKLHLRDDQT